MRPQVGQVINNKYRLLRLIGDGGMGSVYRAEPASGVTLQPVALKLIKRGMDSEEILKRFLRERDILARLDHPNIARLLDGGMSDDGRPWFAMELVEGEALLDYCDRRRLDLDARVDLFLQICAAVEYAHSSLIVHRDLKPGNVLVTATGQAQVYDDPAAALAGTETRSADVSLDLVFDTAGEPYRYQLATRYEIPCTVGGTVVVDGITHAITAAPGQRDHSWGVRDWWAMDWVWFALHLDDGTHLHAVDIRIPGAPHIGIGYAQREGALVELTTVEAREVFGSNGLPISTELVLQPGDLRVATEVVAQAPVRLVNDDGRIADFPRAWMSARTADGRTGVGWMEWNRNPAR